MEMLSGTIERNLTEEKVKDVLDLLKTCNKHDGTKTELYLKKHEDEERKDYFYYNNGNLVGFLVIYPSYREGEVQITGLVHPNSRRNGVFKNLLNAAIADVKDRKKIIRFIKDNSSKSGLLFLESIGAKYIESSYTMKYQAGKKHEFMEILTISNAKMDEIDKLVEIGMEAFETSDDEERPLVKSNISNEQRRLLVGHFNNQIIGCVLASLEDDKATIGDLAVKKEYRKRGFGRELLNYVIEDVMQQGIVDMSLSVNTDNGNALMLYKSCGFKVKNAIDFYKIEI